LVDDLVAACSENNIQLLWRDGRCRISSCGDEWEETIDLPVRRSVFRAILARVATLCNIQQPASVSPYGGTADLAGSESAAGLLSATFVNTPAEQMLSLAPRVSRLSKV
jgi:hypothetical protein